MSTSPGTNPPDGPWPDRWATAPFCYLTTTGRQTGRPHTIEIWFALHQRRLYLLSGNGGRADWVRNLRAESCVQVRLGDQTRSGRARVVTEPAEDALARRLLVDKYQPSEDDPLDEWGRTALPVVVEFPPAAATVDVSSVGSHDLASCRVRPAEFSGAGHVSIALS